MVPLDVKHATYRLLALHDAPGVGDRNPGDVHGRLQLVEHFADMKWMSSQRRVSPKRSGCRLLALERRRGHLPAGHSIQRVVYEYAPEMLAPACRLECVVEADRSEIAIPLVGDRNGLRTSPADACRRCGGTPVRRRHVGRVPIVVREHAATYRIDENGVVLKPKFGASLRYQLVHDAMATAWTVMGCSRVRLSAARKLTIHSLLLDHAHFGFPAIFLES